MGGAALTGDDYTNTLSQYNSVYSLTPFLSS